MKLTIKILLALMPLLWGCTHNNGDIGVYYGTWALTELTVDGAIPDNFDAQSVTWSFQHTIINIQVVDNDLHEGVSHWGTWSEDDRRLILDYTHSDSHFAPGTGQYSAPAEIFLPQNAVTTLDIDSQTGRKMTLSWTDNSGHRIVYTLEKTW